MRAAGLLKQTEEKQRNVLSHRGRRRRGRRRTGGLLMNI